MAQYPTPLRPDSGGTQSHTEKRFDTRAAWLQSTKDIVKFCPLLCEHYPAEQIPEETYAELHGFFKS